MLWLTAASTEKTPKKTRPICMTRLAPEPVADASPGEEQSGEGQAVGVDDPLQRGGRRTEVPAEAGQGDVDDRVVHHHQEHGEAEHREDQPPAVVVIVSGGGLGRGRCAWCR